jgi:hypothetical protein
MTGVEATPVIFLEASSSVEGPREIRESLGRGLKMIPSDPGGRKEGKLN